MTLLHFGGDHTAALATPHETTESFRIAVILLRMPAFGHNLLHFIEKPLFNDGRMPPFVYLAAVFKEADIERIGENELHAVFVRPVVEVTFDTVRLKKYRNILQPRITFGVELKGGANHFRLLAVNDNRFCSHVIQIADRSSRGKLAALHFKPQPPLHVGTQIADKLIRHTELHRHHQDIVRRIMTPVVRADMLDNILLQQPAYLPAVYWITRQAVELPTDNALRLTLMYPLQHFVKHRATGHLRAPLLYELRDNF